MHSLSYYLFSWHRWLSRLCRSALSGASVALLSPTLLFLLILLAAVALTGCGQRTVEGGQAQPADGTALAAPTTTDALSDLPDTSTAVPPAPTADLPPAPTLTAFAALTVIPVPTDIPGLQATHIARATASPFPTAEVEPVRTAQPSGAVVESAYRAGLSLELRLAGDSYLVGENGRAEITLRNDSSTLLFGGNIQLLVQDDAGRSVDPWLLMPGPRGGWPGQNRFAGMLRPLEPGQSISRTLTFQMPALDSARGHTYTARAAAQLSRADIQHPDRSDNVPANVQTALVQLRVVGSTTQQRLKAELQANRQGYTLRVTGEDGKPVAGPLWGALDVDSGRGSMSGPLQDSASGVWTSGWDEYLTQDGTPLQLRIWVAARGYLPATVEQTIPGTGAGADRQAPPPIYTPVPTVVP